MKSGALKFGTGGYLVLFEVGVRIRSGYTKER